MTDREKTTIGVVLVLLAVGGWFVWHLVEAGGIGASQGGAMLVAVVAITVLTAIAAGAVALISGEQKPDERDHQIALKSQMVRGYLYLALAFGLFGVTLGRVDPAVSNAMFLAILFVEIVSGLLMLILYRQAG